MALLNKQISSLVGGVSQQPDSTKFDSQCRLQENFLSSAATGLLKRAPASYINNLGTITENSYIKFIDRDVNEKYIIVIEDGTIKVFDLDGVEQTVTVESGASYLTATTNARDAFATLTIADTTVVVNKTVEVIESTQTTQDRNPEALVVVKEGKYGKTYKVRVFDDQGNSIDTASYTVPDGSDASHTAQADTTYIATQLKNSLVADITGQGITYFDIVQEGNIIWIKSNNGTDFEITTEDGFGDTAMYAIKDSVSLFSDLPRKAPDGFVTAVAGADTGVISGQYYVKAERDIATPLSGIKFPTVTWEESVQANISVGFDSSTMPHTLVRNADGTFTFKQAEYNNRTVGDLDNAENPSYVGDKINGVFFNANRLGFISGESVSMSESGNIFNFYPTSVATLLSSDPVIFTLNSPKVSILRHAVPFNEQVILFSDKHQFVMQSEGNVTNSTISAQSATDFSINSKVAPLAVGNNIYFANNNGEYTEVREYFVADIVTNKDAANVTAHIPTYIAKDVNWMVASDNAKTVVMTSGEDLTSLFVYQVLWDGDNKLQSSWHKFNFNDYEIIGGEFIGTMLYMFLRKPGETDVMLQKMDMSETLVDNGGDFIIYLDNRINTLTDGVLGSYFSATDKTWFDLPNGYLLEETNFHVVNGEYNSDKYGEDIPYTIQNGSVVLDGDYTSIKLYFGNTYSSIYEFGSVFLKEGQQASKSVTAGRTQVLKTLINYDSTAQFDVVVTIEGRTPTTTSFYGRVKGGISNIFGKIALANGVFKVPVNGKNVNTKIAIVNNGHLPSNIQFAEFLLRYQNNTGQRAQ